MKIVCKNCGWSWNRDDGGVNPCKCHKCGYNNKDMYGKKIIGLGAVRTYAEKNRHTEYYRGFGINFYRGEWVASAYANPTFYDTNKSRLKKQIRDYLK